MQNLEKEVNEELSDGKLVQWDLTRLYGSPDDPSLEEDIRILISESDKLIEDFKGRIQTESVKASELKIAIEREEDLMNRFFRLSMFSFLSHSTDSKEPAVQKLLRKIDDLESQLESKLLFLKLELSKVSEDFFNSLMNSTELADYRHHLDLIRTQRKHMLSEPEERIMVLKEITGKKAILNLYDEFTSSFTYRITTGASEETLTESEVETLRRDHDSELRKKAFESLFRKAKENSIVLTNLYNSLSRDWDLEADKRGYDSPISMRNELNEVSDEAVNCIIDATTDGYSVVHDYYRLKAIIMGREALLHSDIYAPVGTSDRTFDWQEAKKMILEVMGNFDPRIESIVARFFDEDYIHGSIMPGKRSGAYCAYASPRMHPYVLVNYNGKMSDVLTLAHELGHGLHGVLASKQTLVNYDTPLTMAETASVFSEMLMTDFLLKNIEEREEKISFLVNRIEEIFATTARQNMFTRFEISAHEKMSGEYLAFEELSELYSKELKLMFGDTVDFLPESEFEWARIPHFFHTPFYCYAYNFAQLLVISLYRKYLEDGAVFRRKYIALLESGGSESPKSLLQKVGIDVSDPVFWQKGISFIKENFLDTLRKMI